MQSIHAAREELWCVLLLNFRGLLQRVFGKFSSHKFWSLEAEEKQVRALFYLGEFLFLPEKSVFFSGKLPPAVNSLREEEKQALGSSLFCGQLLPMFEAHGLISGLNQLESALCTEIANAKRNSKANFCRAFKTETKRPKTKK